MRSKDNILKKWTPIFESIGIQNETLLEIFCLFAEDYQEKEKEGTISKDFPEVIKDLLYKLKVSKKLKVTQTKYNALTGKLEYELENGLIVDEDNKFNKDLSQEELISVFGIEFIREINKEEFREKRLNSIING